MTWTPPNLSRADLERERTEIRGLHFGPAQSRQLTKIWLWSFCLTLAGFAVFAAILFNY